MRKLAEYSNAHSVQCDNKNCDFKIPDEEGNVKFILAKYLNEPCPKCGENLLTEQDFLDTLRFFKMLDWMNKWFSWITYFIPEKYFKKTSVRIHKGVLIQGKN